MSQEFFTTTDRDEDEDSDDVDDRHIEITIAKKESMINKPTDFVDEPAKVTECIEQNDFLNDEYILENPKESFTQVSNNIDIQ